MSAFLIPQSNYRTFVTALTNTTKTPIYTVGDDEELWADVIGIAVCDSTGALATEAIIYATIGTGYTERTLARPQATAPSATRVDNLYMLEFPLHLELGGSIAVKGDNGHHCWVTIIKGERVDTGRASTAT